MNTLQDLTKSVDSLTGLHRSYAFLKMLSEIAQEKTQCKVMILGIDNFKVINNLYTYSFGNKVLQYLAQKLKDLSPTTATLFRLDGDNFGIVFVGATTKQCDLIYNKIAHLTPEIDGISLSFTVSAGICNCPEFAPNGDVLYSNVCLALDQAKSGTKNACHYYTPDISEDIKNDMIILECLRNSVLNDFKGFNLYYQPIIDNATKTLRGCEALLRFSDETFPKGVSPYRFVPLLERSGLILKVGRWVISAAMAQCAKWQELNPKICMNINISALQLDDPNFPQFILEEISKYTISPNSIILELTESEHAAFEKIRDFFDYMRKHGFQTALDDFGTGYASLDIFRQVSADELKIDRSFLERITNNVTDQILLKTMLDMCRKMNILVCVEGIENKDTEDIVSQMNPALLQGYKYSRPISSNEFEEIYITNNSSEPIDEKTNKISPFSYTNYRPAQPMTFAEIMHNANSGIFQVGLDKEFTFLTCNEGYRRMLGYTSKEMEEKFGNKALGFVHPDDVEWVTQEILRQLNQGDTINIEFRIVRSDGYPLWILGTGNVVRTSEGNPSLIVNIIENDKRKRKTLKLQEKLTMYEKILDLLPTGIKYIRYDPEFTIEYISPGFLSILGYTLQDINELFDGKYINLVYEEDRQKTINDVIEQLHHADVVHLHYRSVCKDGSIIWLETISRLCGVDSDGIKHCCSSVVNVTETITEKEKSRSLNISNRLHEAAQIWGEVLFEYNFNSKKLFMSESFSSMFGYDLPENSIISPELILKDESYSKFLNLIQEAFHTSTPTPIEIPATKKDGSTIWCRILANLSEHKQIGGQNISIIGKFFDIDAEYREREKLRIASETDPLTGLCNKGSVDVRILSQLKKHPDLNYTCWVLDVDYFKNINDTLGHFAGDKFLVAIGKRLQKCFRQSDIIGRIGGDEFLVFSMGNTDSDWQTQKANQLLEVLREPITLNNELITPSLSIGISRYPKDGTTFSDLYQNADKALYRAKIAGKNTFCLF